MLVTLLVFDKINDDSAGCVELRYTMAVLDNQSVWRLQSSLRVLFRVCGVWVTYRQGYFRRSMFLPVISGVQAKDNKNDNS